MATRNNRKPETEKGIADLALRSGRVGTWRWDFRSERVEWSDNMEEIHGMPAGSFDGSVNAFQETVHPGDRDRVTAAIAKALNGGEQYQVEYRNLTASADIIWLTARGQVLRDENGEAVAMAGVCMDVTERKRAELRLATQYAVTRLLAEADDLSQITPELLKTICEAADWEVGELWRWDNDRQLLKNEGQWCAQRIIDAGFETATQGAVFEPGKGLPGRVWVSGKAAWIASIENDNEFVRKESAARAGLKAAFAFPVRNRRSTIGVIAFLSNYIREPDEQLLEMFDALGGQIGNVIERRDAEVALRIRAEQQTVVAQLGQKALARPELEELLQDVVERIATTLRVEYVKILELQQDGSFLVQTGVGWQVGVVGETVIPPGLDSQAGFTLDSSTPIIVADLTREERFSGNELLHRHKVVSGISTVIHGRTRPYGVLTAHTTLRRTFTEDDTNFLQAVANVIAMAIESGQAEETIRRLSTPILPLHEHMLILPVIGEIDTLRVQQLGDQLLSTIRSHRAKVVVIDVTGAAPLEPDIVAHLMRSAEAARLLGAKIIMTGISNEVGKALVAAGVERTQITSLADLRSGVEEAQRLLQYMLSSGTLARTMQV
jgi:PAS domain S-box-containing protein